MVPNPVHRFIVKLTIDSLKQQQKSIKIDAAQPEILSFFIPHILIPYQKPGPRITHNALRLGCVIVGPGA